MSKNKTPSSSWFLVPNPKLSGNTSSSSSGRSCVSWLTIVLTSLIIVSFLMSIGLVSLLHFNTTISTTTDESIVSRSSSSSSFLGGILSNYAHHPNNKSNLKEVILNSDSRSTISKGQRKQSNDFIPDSSSNNNQVTIPYFPPFALIPNGEQLAAETLSGTNPSVAGIVHILQMFLLELRESNKQNQNVSNDKKGEDIVRKAYFNIAKKHLVPLDSAYRGKNIFPVRVDEESIFISLAAFREHLLFDTLAGAFGQAKDPKKIYVGVVIQNCFGRDDVTGEVYGCKTGAQVIGKDPKTGKDMTKVSDAPPDVNGVEVFCKDEQFQQYCLSGQVRVLSVHESESLGPAVARYYASKLWNGETYFLQADAHLQFTALWDIHYVNELKATSNFPKSILSMYPPGFGHLAGETPGTRLCTCEFSENGVEDHIIRINNGVSYSDGVEYPKPTQIPFIAAGFFFTRGEFLKDVPFDPFLPWAFMGEEIALSMRAWTAGWDIYAPRKNWIAHQYRPGRLGLPKFWGSVGRAFKRGIGFSNRLQSQVVNRIKHMVGYPEATFEAFQQEGIEDILEDMQYYGLGTVRSKEEYTTLTNIDFDKKVCRRIPWCNQGTLT